MVDAPEEVVGGFATLADETRMAILYALATHRRDDPEAGPPSFMELYELVDVDDTGRFNYHLGELRGRFVRKTDGGWELTTAGRRAIAAAVAGRFGTHDRRTEPANGDCVVCGSAVSLTYEQGILRVSCEDGHDLGRFPVPPGVAVDTPLAEVLDVAWLLLTTKARVLARGHCWFCYSPVAASVDRETTLHRFVCGGCGWAVQLPATVLVRRHPAVVAFLERASDDVDHEQMRAVREFEDLALVSEAPVRVAVEVTRAGKTLRVTVDESGNVVDVEPP